MIVILILFTGFVGTLGVMYFANSTTEIESTQEEGTESSSE